MDSKKILGHALTYFFGSIALIWLIVEVSEWSQIKWFIPSFFAKYTLHAWIGVPLLISLIRILLLIKQQNASDKNSHSKTVSMSSISIPKVLIKNNIGKKVKIKVGNYIVISKGCAYTEIKVIVKDIVKTKLKKGTHLPEEEQDVAIIKLDGGGCIFHGGQATREISVNEFSVPIMGLWVEEECSVYKFCSGKGDFSFFGIYVEHINPHSKEVEFNISYIP